jgi:hypothetical protein
MNEPPTIFADQPIVFPDPISSIMEITGATLLYFDHPLVIALPATVLPQVAEKSLKLFEIVARRQPEWGTQLLFALQAGQQQARGAASVLNRLKPLQEAAFISIYFSYNADRKAFSRASAAATSIAARLPEPIKYVTIPTASNDLCRHIFLQSFLDAKGDLDELYEHCNELFSANSFEHLLLSAYLLRLAAVKPGVASTGMLLINPAVTTLLAEAMPDTTPVKRHKAVDVIAWEIFRCIVSPRLDPITDRRIMLIGEIRSQRATERVALADRCRSVAVEVLEQRGNLAPPEIAKFVTSRIEPEIKALFNLDGSTFRVFVDELLTDKGTWVSMAGTLAGVAAGTSLLTAAAAVTGLASIGSAAYKSKQSREAAVRSNDYRLLYFINQRAKPDG